jgi:hypothetical protein
LEASKKFLGLFAEMEGRGYSQEYLKKGHTTGRREEKGAVKRRLSGADVGEVDRKA